MPLGPCSGFKVKCRHFSILSSFFFFFSFLFFLFLFFLEAHWPFIHGVLNLLNVVNETRIGFAKFRRLDSFSAYC